MYIYIYIYIYTYLVLVDPALRRSGLHLVRRRLLGLYIYIYIYVYIYIYTYIHYIYIYIYMFDIYIYIYMLYVYIYIYAHIYLSIYLSIYPKGGVRPISLLRLSPARFLDSGKFPLDLRIPPLKIKITLESSPLKPRILVLVRRLAAVKEGGGLATCAVSLHDRKTLDPIKTLPCSLL